MTAATPQSPPTDDSTWNAPAEPDDAGTPSEQERREAALQRLEAAGVRSYAYGFPVLTSALEQAVELIDRPDQRGRDPRFQALLDAEARSFQPPTRRPGLWQRWRDRPRSKRLSWQEAARRADEDLSGR